MALGWFRLVKRVPAAYERPRCIILVDDSFVVVMVVGFGTLPGCVRSRDRPTDGRRPRFTTDVVVFMRSSFVLVLLSNHMLLCLLHTQQLTAAASAPTMYH
jgi:hypothetical protein